MASFALRHHVQMEGGRVEEIPGPVPANVLLVGSRLTGGLAPQLLARFGPAPRLPEERRRSDSGPL